MDNNKRLWFDTEHNELVTFGTLLREYRDYIMGTITNEDELIEFAEQPEMFTFDVWVRNCSVMVNGTLMEVKNADKFRVERKGSNNA